MIDLPLAFLKIAKEVKAGTFKPRVVQFGEADHVVTLVLNPALDSRIPAAAKARIDSTQAQMLSGKLSIAVPHDSAAKK